MKILFCGTFSSFRGVGRWPSTLNGESFEQALELVHAAFVSWLYKKFKFFFCLPFMTIYATYCGSDWYTDFVGLQ